MQRHETKMPLDIPMEKGARIEIPSWDTGLRRELEGRGFFMESGTLQTYVMRRDFRDGFLMLEPLFGTSFAGRPVAPIT